MKHIALLLVLASVCTSSVAQTVDQRRALRPRRLSVWTRAEPPKRWNKSSEAIFAADAFLLLGDKPVPVVPLPPVPPKPAPVPPFDRSAVMKQLEKAQDDLVAVLADEKRFSTQQKDFEKSIKVLFDNAEALVTNDSEYKEDDTYIEIAKALRDAADVMPTTLKTDGFGGMGGAVGRLKKACNECHAKYRL
jgi:cytochrome c556